MILISLILSLTIFGAKGQSPRGILCKNTEECQVGEYCDLNPMTCGIQGCLGECKQKGPEQSCPPERECGNTCCERGEVCRYLNGTESCGPMVSRPIACKSDDEERCGAGDQCCGPEELCNAIPEDPTKFYCEHYLGCQPNGQERQCINKCCMEGEICAAYASNDIDDSLNFICNPAVRRCSINYEQNCKEGEECAVNVSEKDPKYDLGVCVSIPKNPEYCVANQMCKKHQLCTRNYSPFALDPWRNPGLCVDTPTGYKPEVRCHRDEGCQDAEFCEFPSGKLALPPLPPILGTCKPKESTHPNCPWQLECGGICCSDGELCSYQYTTPHKFVCTRPTTRRCSIHYAKNCIFGEACAVDVLNEDPWFSLGTCVTLPTENKRFCIRNTMCMEGELCTRNYGPFVMDPWHNPGMCAPKPK